MKKLILLSSLSLFLFSCGDNNGSSSNVKSENNIKNNDLPKKEVKKLKEVVIERYSEGDKKIIGFYDGEGSNEVIVKRVHYYSQNDGGGKTKEENYKNGKLEGKYYEWYKNGNENIDCNYKNGKLEGKYYEWYDKNEWESLSVISTLGDGKKIDCNYKNGKLEGEHWEWTNYKQIQCDYKNGKLEGKYLESWMNGSLEQNYKNGKLEGKSYEYYNGKFSSGREYYNGELINSWGY